MLRALIVDDEPLARQRLRKLLAPLEEQERLVIVGEAGDAFETLEGLEEHEVDLLFLDIQMPELDGFDLLERLPADERRPVVIFVTAYDEYALRAFEANAVDYLLKPIARNRLEEAVTRAEKLHQPASRSPQEDRLDQLLEWIGEQSGAPSNEGDYLTRITIPYRDRILVFPVEDVVSAEIEESTTHLFVLKNEDALPKPHLQSYVVNYTLDELEANLNPAHFMRVHRSSIVQIDHIKEMISWFSGRYKLILTTGHEVVASRQRSRNLKDRLSL